MAGVGGRAKAFVLGFVIAASVGARFYLAWTAPSSVDLESYGIVAAQGREGLPLYESTSRYNYSPVWSWAIAGLDAVSRAAGLPFDGVTRSLLAGVDLGVAALVFLLARRSGRAPWTCAALFLVNPVGIWVSSVQGQFDNVAVLCLLAALSAGTAKRSGPWLFASIAVKQVTLVHPILWIRRRKDALAVALVYAAAAALFLAYWRQWRAILAHVVFYRGVPRSYGFSEWVLADSAWALPLGLTALAAAGAAAWLLRLHDPVRASLFVFLVLLFFAPGLGSQYLMWPLPFAALHPGWRALLFSAAAILWILGSHYSIPGSGRWMGQILWLSVALWGSGEIRALTAERRLAWRA